MLPETDSPTEASLVAPTARVNYAKRWLVIGALAATLSVPGPTQTAAVITLAVTASGVVVAGIGSAFWGLVAGVVVWAILTGGASEDAVSAGAPPRS